MAQARAQLQALSEEYQKLQQGKFIATRQWRLHLTAYTDLQSSVDSRQKLDGQRQENLSVQKEFETLAEDETIYKLSGPVLLKQEKFEAESTVKGRLDYISNEMSRLETQIKETQGKIEKKRTEIIQVQTAAQQAAGNAGGQ